MIDVTTKEARKWILHLNPDWNPSPMIVALFSHCDSLEHRVERMQAVVDAAIRWRDAREKVLLVSEQNLGQDANHIAGAEWKEAVDALIAALDAAREGKR